MKDREILLEALKYCISNDAIWQNEGCVDEECGKNRPTFESNPNLGLANVCGVTSLLYPLAHGRQDDWSDVVRKSATVSANRFYRMLFVARQLIDGLDKQGIKCVLIKGPDTASNYPVPEYRSFGDIDLLLCDRHSIEKADIVMQTLGCKKRKLQDSNHHIEYTYDGRINIELHSRVTRSFGNKSIDEKIDNIFDLVDEKVCMKDIIGSKVRCLRPAYNGLFALLHMLQHMLAAGFGIKQICDFTAFWNNNNMQEAEQYLDLVDFLGIRCFSDTVVRVCELYMGLKHEVAATLISGESLQDLKELDALAANLLGELFEAGQFGEGNSSRFVSAMSSRKRDLLRVFHTQMKENFPRLGKVWVLWPFLWLVTLIVFLRNNRKIRGTSTGKIIKDAKKRGKLIEKMRLFEI